MVAAVHLDEVDSTNAEALRRAAAGERGPLWITAGRQTAGRGRAGRSWGTPDGNLAATLLFAPGCPPTALAGLSLVAGVATHAAVARHLRAGPAESATPVPPVSPELRLKWPNDLLLAGGKLSGCLTESSIFGVETVVAIGIGINVAVAPPVAGRAVTCLAAHGARVDAGTLAADLAARLLHWLAVWDRGQGLGTVREAWLRHAGPLGEAVTVNTGNGRLAGTFAGLAADGAMLLDEAGGGRRRITFGDVSIGTT